MKTSLLESSVREYEEIYMFTGKCFIADIPTSLWLKIPAFVCLGRSAVRDVTSHFNSLDFLPSKLQQRQTTFSSSELHRTVLHYS